jgi:L-arabinokinase
LDLAIRDIPLIARRSAHTRSECRRALGLPDGTLLLLSFGGYGLRGLNPGTPERLPDCTLVITDDASGSDLWRDRPSRDRLSRNVAQISESELRRRGYRYEDLVRAVDIVVTKPGYGIVSECIANDTAILYTSRGRFPEYDVLVTGMQRCTRSQFIPQEALLSGDWGPYITRLLAARAPDQRPAIDGARVAAEMIVQMLT